MRIYIYINLRSPQINTGYHETTQINPWYLTQIIAPPGVHLQSWRAAASARCASLPRAPHTTQTHRNRQTDKDWVLRETEAIIGKAPRLGIYTSEEPNQRLGWCGPDSKRNVRGQHQFGIKDVIIGLCVCCATHVHPPLGRVWGLECNMVGCGREVVGCGWVGGVLWCGVEGWRGHWSEGSGVWMVTVVRWIRNFPQIEMTRFVEKHRIGSKIFCEFAHEDSKLLPFASANARNTDSSHKSSRTPVSKQQHKQQWVSEECPPRSLSRRSPRPRRPPARRPRRLPAREYPSPTWRPRPL